jgi:hypothetical protein
VSACIGWLRCAAPPAGDRCAASYFPGLAARSDGRTRARWRLQINDIAARNVGAPAQLTLVATHLRAAGSGEPTTILTVPPSGHPIASRRATAGLLLRVQPVIHNCQRATEAAPIVLAYIVF